MTGPTLAVLETLLEDPSRPFYGLELINELGFKSGSLYPMLARLERIGWLESCWEDVDCVELSRPRRRLYRLTTTGVLEAQEAIEKRSHHKSSESRQPMPGQPMPGLA